MTHKYPPRVHRNRILGIGTGKSPGFPTEKESLQKRFKPIDEKQQRALICWAESA